MPDQPDITSAAPVASAASAASVASAADAAPASRRAWSLGVVLTALLGSLLFYHRLWADPSGSTIGSWGHINDPMQGMWNLKWVAWQLVHGHNPLSTDAIYYPHGVSLTWNTLMPTLGILAAPVTLTLGPAVAYALLMTAAPVLTSLTGFWWLRRHTATPAAAALGGLAIGFSPYMTGHMLGHLNLTFTALVPVMLILFEDLLRPGRRPTWRTALYLGAVTAAQAGISEELILIVVIGIGLALAAAAVTDPQATRMAARAALPGFALAVAVFLVLSAPLLVDQVFLAQHVPLPAAWWSAGVDDYLLPLPRFAVDLGWTHTSLLGGTENSAYLGPLLIAVLAVGIGRTWRDRSVRIAGLTLAALVVLSFGTTGPGGVPLPWRYLSDLPVLESILPVRFTFASWFVIAWLLSRWTDRLLSAPAQPRLQPRAIALAAIVVALAVLVPRPAGTHSLPAPTAFFTRPAILRVIPPGAPVLLLPSPSWYDASGMYYQALADFRFDQPGGYALRAEHGGAAYGPPDSPLLRICAHAHGAGRPAYRGVDLAAARHQLTAQRYRAIVVVDKAPDANRLADLAARLTGRPDDRHVAGVRIWLLTARH